MKKTDRREKQFRIQAFIYMMFNVWAVILQIFLQKYMGVITSWGFSPGWQREIGLWNVGAALFILRSLFSEVEFGTHVIPILLIWSGLFGLNHLIAFIQMPQAHGHLGGVVMNVLPFIWTISILIFFRKEAL